MNYEPGVFLTGFTPILSFTPSSYICGHQLPFNWLPLLVLLHHDNPLLTHRSHLWGVLCHVAVLWLPWATVAHVCSVCGLFALSVDSDRPAFSHSSLTQRSRCTKRPELVATVLKSHLRMINNTERQREVCVSSFLRGSDSLVPHNRAYWLLWL